MLDAYARRIAHLQSTDGRTDLRTKTSFVTFERKLTFSNAREKFAPPPTKRAVLT